MILWSNSQRFVGLQVWRCNADYEERQLQESNSHHHKKKVKRHFRDQRFYTKIRKPNLFFFLSFFFKKKIASSSVFFQACWTSYRNTVKLSGKLYGFFSVVNQSVLLWSQLATNDEHTSLVWEWITVQPNKHIWLCSLIIALMSRRRQTSLSNHEGNSVFVCVSPSKFISSKCCSATVWGGNGGIGISALTCKPGRELRVWNAITSGKRARISWDVAGAWVYNGAAVRFHREVQPVLSLHRILCALHRP